MREAKQRSHEMGKRYFWSLIGGGGSVGPTQYTDLLLV